MSYTAKSEDDDVAQIFLEKVEKDLRRIIIIIIIIIVIIMRNFLKWLK